MNKVFTDTYYFLALLNSRDQGHAAAVTASARITSLLTTEWILLELANALASTTQRKMFDITRKGLQSNQNVHIEPISPMLHEQGITLFHNRPDKEWSLTDCISFVVMQREGLSEALTADRHFEQAGFTILM
jgi:predicted nucleic acid-binding protein